MLTTMTKTPSKLVFFLLAVCVSFAAAAAADDAHPAISSSAGYSSRRPPPVVVPGGSHGHGLGPDHNAASSNSTPSMLHNFNIAAGSAAPFPFPNGTYIDRTFFPPDFIFGTITMAVKHEGAANVDIGKADSIWDAYAAIDNGFYVKDGTMPRNVGDHYYRYKEDIGMAADMGMEAMRISIAWTRIFPNGTTESPNSAAISHYNDVINYLHENGIEPHVTLWSQDHPQALEESYEGPLSPLFIDDFVRYANVCFAEFGDRVKYWITIDEPNDYLALAYATTMNAPGRCSINELDQGNGNCTHGNSSTEPYMAGHNLLRAHAAAANLYKQSYQEAQGGSIGISLWFKWFEPRNSTDSGDISAAGRAQDFFFGWFMDPLASGEYPASMREILGSRLPSFTEEEAALLKQSWDFLGLNAVTARYAYAYKEERQDSTPEGYYEDNHAGITAYALDGSIIGVGDQEYSVPWMFIKMIAYMREHYGNPPMYITETGWGISLPPTLEENLNDADRIQYFYSYYSSLSQAIRDGGNVKGVFAWSLIDGFEFFLGLYVRFGLVYVDENMERYPRLSAYWHKMVLQSNRNTSSHIFATANQLVVSELSQQT